LRANIGWKVCVHAGNGGWKSTRLIRRGVNVFCPLLHRRKCRDVEDHRAAIDIRHIRAVGVIRPDLDLMRPIAIVERLVPWRETAGQTLVALTSAGQPPAPDLARLARIAQIDDDPDLIVLRVGRVKVRHAGREMRELDINDLTGGASSTSRMKHRSVVSA
jgi:hypothetical protein